MGRSSDKHKEKSHKKHKSSKKHKKEHEKSKSERHDRKKESKAGGTGKRQSGFFPLSEEDYFKKSLEFRVWLRLALQKNFEDLSAEEARRWFAEGFLVQYNEGALDLMYYTGDIPLEIKRSVGGTRHRWALALTAEDMDKLADLAEDVERQTHTRHSE